MKQTRAILNENLGDAEDVDAVIISHLHGDHIALNETLSVFQQNGVELDFDLYAAPLYNNSQVVKFG